VVLAAVIFGSYSAKIPLVLKVDMFCAIRIALEADSI
jgi:hypothetical protein